jgi:hypothetical protein
MTGVTPENSDIKYQFAALYKKKKVSLSPPFSVA